MDVLLQGPAIEPFQDDAEKEKYYGDLLRMGTVDGMDDAAVEAEMEAALKEYNLIGADLGIVPKACQIFGWGSQPCAPWIIGEERVTDTADSLEY